MTEFDAIFDGIQNAQTARAPRTPRIPMGTHNLVLAEYGPRKSEKQPGQPGYGEGRVQAGFVVEQSFSNPDLKQGAPVDWAWLTQKPDWKGVKEKERAAAFLDVIAKTLGDTRERKALAADLTAGKYRGLRIRVIATQAMKNGQPLVSPKYGPILDLAWSVIEGQTADTIAAGRAWCDQVRPVVVQPPAAPQPAYTPSPAQYAPPPAAAYPGLPPQPAYAPPAQAPAPVQAAPTSLPPFLANLPKVG